MGSAWFTGGVVAAPRGRIQFDFTFHGIRYRPSIKRPPSEANLRRARERLEAIKHQIRLGTFSFEEEFPDYRFVRRLSGTSSARLCSDVFDAYLVHCEARLRRNDMAAATVRSYRKILDGVWRPHLGDMFFSHIQHGHSIATMLRAYAAWAEGTAEVDVEAIKRSMNASEAPPAINLAVDLSVAEALQAKRALEARPTRTARTCANRLFRHGEMAVSQTTENLAGVEGFEPPNGGIKTR
jgi:hypothetical protein